MSTSSRVLIVGAALGVLLALVVALGDSAANAATRATPTRLMVSGAEFRLALSRQSIVRGPSVIQFVNRGEDPHDLVMQKVGSPTPLQFPEIGSGKLATLDAKLGAGRYRLWCSLPQHAARGMRATLRVRRPN